MVSCRLADLQSSTDIQLIVASTQAYYSDEQGMGVPMPSEVADRLRDQLASHPGLVVGLAFAGDLFAGSALCVHSFGSFRAMPILNIHDLSVLPSYRGRGIGRALLAWAEDHARSLGCSHVTLEVGHDNIRARGLYRSVGYSVPENPNDPCTYFAKKAL